MQETQWKSPRSLNCPVIRQFAELPIPFFDVWTLKNGLLRKMQAIPITNGVASVVTNYNRAHTADSYVHRIGTRQERRQGEEYRD